MLASSDSDRWYSASMAFSARSISRIAYQTVATTITAENMAELTKPTVSDQCGPKAPVIGDEEFQSDGRGDADCHDRRCEDDAFDAEHQNHEGGRDEEVELQARARPDRVADETHEEVREQEERQRGDQLAEPIQQRDGGEDRREDDVEQADPPHLAAKGQLEDPEHEGDGGADPRRDLEDPQPAR